MKMRKVFSIIFAFALVLSCFCPVFADELAVPNASRVADYADLYTDEQEDDLAARIAQIYEKHDMDLVILTSLATYGSGEGSDTWRDTADDFYDNAFYGVGDDLRGTCFFICMDPGNRGWWTSAKGAAMQYYSYEAINYIDDTIEPYMKEGRYYDAAVLYLSLVDTLYTDGGFPEPAVAQTEPETMSDKVVNNLPSAIGCGLVIGLIVGAIVLASKRKAMKTVAFAADAEEYLDGKSFDLRVSKDHFLYRTVTKKKKPSSKSGGRSSYSGGHRSSSGSMHSGGGRGF